MSVNFNPMFVYFSQLLDKPVIDSSGQEVGALYDIIVKATEVYPQSSHLIIRKGSINHQYAVVPWANVAERDNKEIRLNIGASGIVFTEHHDNKEELTLRRDILDQQVVDTYNHKAIRVNDIHLLAVDHSLMIAHVDISLRGLFRRLGFEGIADFLVGLFNKNAGYLKTEHLISWKHIQPLSVNPVSKTIKVNFPQKKLNSIPAADLGEIFLDLNIKDQMVLFKSLDLNTRAKIFLGIDFKYQRSLIEELPDNDVAAILNAIPTDEATDFLEKLPKDQVNRFLGIMENKQAKKLSQLLGYSSDSAGGLMTADFLSVFRDMPVEAVLAQIRERAFKVEPAQFVYIVDENNRLVGATNFRRLIIANPADPVSKTTFAKTYFVNLNSSVKEVAYLMEKYKYYAIPVVDDNNSLQGIITVDDILSQVISIAWRRLKKIKVLPKQ
ncbi:MAG: CBS domain-containing protein [Candidatus Omnitrophota bacterium]